QGAIQFGYVDDAPRSKLQIACASGSLGRIVAVFGVWPCRMPDVIDRVARSVQFPGNVHQLSAQVRENIAEPRCVVTRMSQVVGQSHRNRIADTEKHDGNGRRLQPRSHEALEPQGTNRSAPCFRTSLTASLGLSDTHATSSTMSLFSIKPTWRRPFRN